MARIRSRDTKTGAGSAAGTLGCRTSWLALPHPPVTGKARPRVHAVEVAVFVDGRFWHGHPDYFTFGKSGAYWDAKIERTQERDRLANEALTAAGWTVIRSGTSRSRTISNVRFADREGAA